MAADGSGAPTCKRRSPDASARAPRANRVAGVVLAGGRSSRMGGVDKAFLQAEGRVLIPETLDLLRNCFPEVVVVANRPDKFRSLGVTVTGDEFPGCGPLAGIHAAMGVVATPYVFVLACDMPFVQRATIEFLVQRLDSQDALIPRWDGDIEPLHGIYATRLRPRIEDALRAGVTAIRAFLPEIDADFVGEAQMRAVPGAERSFLNINTPEDAARFDLRL